MRDSLESEANVRAGIPGIPVAVDAETTGIPVDIQRFVLVKLPFFHPWALSLESLKSEASGLYFI